METSYKQRAARTTLSRYVSATNTLKCKSHVRDSEIGCYPRLSMDPFQPEAAIFQFISRRRIRLREHVSGSSALKGAPLSSCEMWGSREASDMCDHVECKPIARKVQVDAMRPLKIWMHPLEIRKVPKIKMLISPMKPCDNYSIHMVPLLSRRGWTQLN